MGGECLIKHILIKITQKGLFSVVEAIVKMGGECLIKHILIKITQKGLFSVVEVAKNV